MVQRIYVEKKDGYNGEAKDLSHELRHMLGIAGLEKLRIINRYDVEGITRRVAPRPVRPACRLCKRVRAAHLEGRAPPCPLCQGLCA